MTLGRPTINMKNSKVPLPAAIDDENLLLDVHNCRQPAGCFSQTQFYIENIKICGILGEILAEVYKPWNESREGSDVHETTATALDTIVALDSTLQDFESHIPRPLNWANDKDTDVNIAAVFSRQRNVLHAR